jgi:hypothetical protein
MKTVSSVVATVFRTIENPIDQNLFPKLGEAQFAFDQIGHHHHPAFAVWECAEIGRTLRKLTNCNYKFDMNPRLFPAWPTQQRTISWPCSRGR